MSDYFHSKNRLQFDIRFCEMTVISFGGSQSRAQSRDCVSSNDL
jgi:hypothetical protein